MIEEINARSALTKSGIPVAQYTINPYVGCTIGCKYCFARFIGAFKYTPGVWGRDVRVRKNIPEILAREINRLGKTTVFLSSACDPYQHSEQKYGITRRILTLLISHRIPVLLMSKSTLIRRDIDLLIKAEGEARVLVSITTDREDVRRILEPGSSTFSERLETLYLLKENGIDAGVFLGPVLPMNAEKVSRELRKIVSTVHIDPLNYASQVRAIYLEMGWKEWLHRERFEEVKSKLAESLIVE